MSRFARHALRRSAILAASLACLALPAAAQQGNGKADSNHAAKGLPLKAARSADFTTSKGSWMSLDLSPDGRTIVFDLLGDIYTMPATGGTATAITHGLPYDAQPRFSPDGSRIVFISDRSGGDNIWTMRADGTDTVQVTEGNDNLYVSPRYTPDGRYIIASKSGGPLGGAAKLWIYDVRGGKGTPLIKEPLQRKTLGAAIDPTGRYVWYAQATGDWTYNAIFPLYELAQYDRETGRSVVTTSRDGSAFRPEISHNGQWLVYGTRYEAKTGLRIRNLETGMEHWLAYPVQRDDQESRAPLDVLPGYAFTPDDQALVVSYGGEFWRVPVDGSRATQIPFTAHVQVAMGPEVRFVYRVDDQPTFDAHQVRDLAVAPDGHRVAFTALDRVYVIDSIGAAPRRLTDLDTAQFQPVWSPDGRSIAFVTWDDAAGGEIYRVSASGGTPRRVTDEAAYYRDLAWSPDGKRLVAVRASARDLQENAGTFDGGLDRHIVWVPASGGAATVIMPAGTFALPQFSARDTSRVFLYSPAEGLVSVRWDGTDMKHVLRVDVPPTPGGAELAARQMAGTDMPDPTVIEELEANPRRNGAQAVRLSPDGGRAVAQIGMQLYAVDVPTGVGADPEVVADPKSAAFPVRKLTTIGGEFPTWSPDGNTVYWGMGNAIATYDLTRAKQVDDSLKAAREARERGGPGDAGAGAKPAADTAHAGYEPVERHIAVAERRDVPHGTAVLRGARVLTMKGHEVIDDADIVIRDDRIVAVGKQGTVTVPKDATVIDMAGKTIVPGFVDTHYHTQWLVPDIHVGQVWQYLAMLAYGVTTTRDPQTSDTEVLTYEDQVETGAMVGPRIYSTGPGVFSSEHIRTLEDARNVLKRYAEYYHTNTLKMYMSGNRLTRQYIIMAAKELGLMPTTEGGLDFKLEMTHAMDGYPGVEHTLPITPLYDDVVNFWARSGTTNSPTLIVSYGAPFGENYWFTNTDVHDDPKVRHFHPEKDIDEKTRRRGSGAGGSPGPGGWFRPEEYAFPLHAAFSKGVVEAGGRVGVGSHGQFQGLGYQWEMWMLAMGGMKPYDVLRCATILGAEGIGMEKDLGSIEPGKMADLVVLDRNPLDNIRNTNTIHSVMKNGRLYDGNTLDEVYPRKRPLPHYLWQDKVPHVEAGIGSN
ncbi:MAG TPA: amidohydrolase family protein [Gemmatimonadaceae bacterium]|nr:amidohydrolase family protein [Gemmatimonadaceae bacterium]